MRTIKKKPLELLNIIKSALDSFIEHETKNDDTTILITKFLE